MKTCGTSSCGSNQPNQEKKHDDENIRLSLGKIANKFLVMSGKGGVGKTSVAVNFSLALAMKGFRVGLMDVDIHGPDVIRMLGITGSMELSENQKLIPMSCGDNLKVVSIEALIPSKDKAIIWRGPMKYSVIRQFIGDVEWGNLDYLVIDSPPGTGDEPLTISQTIPDAQAIIVTTPQEISLADVRKSINFCRTVNMNIVGIIENMSGFVCPHCAMTVDLFGVGGGEKTAANENLPFLGRVPFDPKLVSCGDDGISFIEKYRESAAAKAFMQIAEKVIQKNKNQLQQPVEGNRIMKFAIPITDGKLTEHFGHCREFAIIDVNDKNILKKEILVPPPHEPGVLPEWLRQLGTNVVIAGGMGQRAADLLAQAGITVVTGAPEQSPESLVMSYLNNTLTSTGSFCAGGDHSHCDHH